jgi:NAD(P)H-hydrate epimerase
MERAAMACSVWIQKKYGRDKDYIVFCGNGNNGGDGLAIARQLADNGCHVEVYIVRPASSDSPDFSLNLSRLKKQGKVEISVFSNDEEPALPVMQGAVVIDAIFGSGLSREPELLAAALIDGINAEAGTVVSIDIPSGLFGDDNSQNSGRHIVRATDTLSFQQPKLSFFFAETAPFTGHFHILPIGLHPDFIAHAQTPYHFVTIDFVRQFLHRRPKFAHKGSFGHALVVAGSRGKGGAAVLATRACLRSGAGLVSACVPRCEEQLIQLSAPEAMLHLNDGENLISGDIRPGKFSAAGIGPGLGTHPETAQSLKRLIQNFHGPVVFDADALNLLAANPTWLAFLPAGSILTPHPGEFDRLTEKHESGYSRMLSQRQFAIRHRLHVVLKGAFTSIACPDGSVYFNSSGNPGMATGGSGDVLTGILTGLLAQGYSPKEACLIGVYVHGLAGDIAASVHAQEGMIAGDIIENLGGAWRMLGEARNQ